MRAACTYTRVRMPSFLSLLRRTRHTPCATAIYLDRLMRSENLLLASQYYNYFISGSLIILLFTTARRDYDYFPSPLAIIPSPPFFVFHLHGHRLGIKRVLLSARLMDIPGIRLIEFADNARFVRSRVIVTANSSSAAALFYR